MEVSETQIEIFEQKLLDKQDNYQLNYEYIDLLKRCKPLKEKYILEREKFSTKFCPDYFFLKSWLNEEKNEKNNKDNLKSLYEKIIFYYPSSCEIWEEYLIFYQNELKETSTNIIKEYKRCLNVVGYDNTKGPKFWKMYIDYLEENLEEEEDNDDKILEIYKNLLTIPSSNLLEFWQYVQNFETDEKEKERLKLIFEKSKDLFEKEINFEISVTFNIQEFFSFNTNKKKKIFDNFMKYISHRTELCKQDNSKLNTLRFNAIVEKALLFFNTEEILWTYYIYMNSQSSIDFVETVFKRAIQNIGVISSEIWVIYFAFYIKQDSISLEKLYSIYQISSANLIKLRNPRRLMEVFKYFCIYLLQKEQKERCISTLTESINYLKTQFPKFDGVWEIEKFKAGILKFQNNGNPCEKGREIFKNVLNEKKNKKNYNIWVSFIDFEKKAKNVDVDYLRNIFKDCINELNDYNKILTIGKEWLNFEITNQSDFIDVIGIKRDLFLRLNSLKPSKKKTKSGNKRKRENKNENFDHKKKKRKVDKEDKEKKNTEKKNTQKQQSSKPKIIFLKGSGKEEFTCFAFDLPLDITEEEIRNLFEMKKCNIKEIRLIKGNKGKVKGYAYIEMNDLDSFLRGLELNNHVLRNKTIRVVQSKPQSQRKRKDNYPRRRNKINKRKKPSSNFKFREKRTKEESNKKKMSNDEFKDLFFS